MSAVGQLEPTHGANASREFLGVLQIILRNRRIDRVIAEGEICRGSIIGRTFFVGLCASTTISSSATSFGKPLICTDRALDQFPLIF